MGEQRFSPKFFTTLHAKLQKQIYLKEEKFLGLANHKQNLIQIFNERPREGSSLSPSPKPNLSTETFKPFIKFPTKPNISLNNLSLEQVYRTRINVATKFKEKFDFKNRSPISWLSKEDKIHSPLKRQSNLNQDINRLSHQLNKKKIIKGMGYEKSFIFSD